MIELDTVVLREKLLLFRKYSLLAHEINIENRGKDCKHMSQSYKRGGLVFTLDYVGQVRSVRRGCTRVGCP